MQECRGLNEVQPRDEVPTKASGNACESSGHPWPVRDDLLWLALVDPAWQRAPGSEVDGLPRSLSNSHHHSACLLSRVVDTDGQEPRFILWVKAYERRCGDQSRGTWTV